MRTETEVRDRLKEIDLKILRCLSQQANAPWDSIIFAAVEEEQRLEAERKALVFILGGSDGT